MKLTLQEIYDNPDYRFLYSGPTEALQMVIAGISIDSREIQPGELYFAIKGEHHDGHKFLREIFNKQAIAAVVEKKWRQKHPKDLAGKALLAVEDTLTALQQAAHAYRKKFAIPILGLTGTNGKTTTKEMIAAVLSRSGNVCKTEGNFNNHIGVPLTLFQLRASHQSLVLEMGTNHFGEIRQLCEIAAPTCGLITNIGHGHLEFLQSLEGVARAKIELFEYLQPEGLAFINLDDALITKQVPKLRRCVTYGFKDEADISAQKLSLDDPQTIGMRVENQTIVLNMPGEHNLSNALAAVAVGLEFGVDMPDIKQALENVQLPSKRMQIIRKEKMLILNDSYNANPDSTLAALSILKNTPVAGKKIFVFGDMLELGQQSKTEHTRIGAALNDFGVAVFLAFGPETAAAVDSARRKTPVITAEHFTDKAELVSFLKTHLDKGDLVLVKGSRGMKMEEVIQALLQEERDDQIHG
ncbi:MAG: UDP-N-acetylmuramoyl-tripeptide--D-alanyl-D-alanine ligase [bacterium]